MKRVRQENLQMKIPALLHLSRLGYRYIPRKQLSRRDRKTNLLPEELREALTRINGAEIGDGTMARLQGDLQAQLEAEDQGRQFYRTLRDGWKGLKLIDFTHPENNRFRSAAEMACGEGAGSFRPDITLFVNGLPLAMIEVKTRNRPGGLRTEYARMLERFRAREARRYLQCAQVWAFSDDCAEDMYRFLPTEGTFYATVMAEDFPVYAVREAHPGIFRRLLPRDPEEEQRILEDNGILERPRTRAFQRSLLPGKPTHRMLTTLFYPERFLLLLRYGIQYIPETEPAGKGHLIRRMLTTEQLSVLEALRGKAKRGYRRWTAPFCGAAGETAVNASLVALLRDLVPGGRMYWAAADGAEMRREAAELCACGVSCATREDAKDGQLILISADGDPAEWLREAEERDSAGQRVFILPKPVPRYGQKTNFAAGLRRADPGAILVTRATRSPEGPDAKEFLFSDLVRMLCP